MSDWPVGLSTGCFYQQSIFDCLDQILAGGFSLIEVCSAPTHLNFHDTNAVHRLREQLDRLGMGAYSFHAPFADRIDITAPDPNIRDASIREVIAAAKAAAIVGARHFVIHPGPEHPEQAATQERLRRLDAAVASLNEIALRCQELGVTCVLENKLPHLLFGRTADMLWILGAMANITPGVCLDTGHAYLAGELWTAIRKFSGHLRMIHASDNSGHFDDHLPPGQGNVDWPQFTRLLRENAFHGTIIMELAGRGTVDEILEKARQARRFLRCHAWQDR